MVSADYQTPESKPPSTGSATPVTKEAASEHNQTTACATSSGRPPLPVGCLDSNHSLTPGPLTKARSIMGVMMRPGHTTLMRMPLVTYCKAADLDTPITPCLLAA